jgi:tRNA nucleotidyltransferase (CCA-adding enzyme)
VKRPGEAELQRALPARAQALLAKLLARADAEGVAVHLVGGPVRDLLLRLPLRDLDLVAEAPPEALAALVGAALPGARVVAHDRFGTLRVEGEGAALDLASARREKYAHAGALPTVEPGSLEEDLWRRDFSVNALALPLSQPARARHGELIDPTGGAADLERRSLRVLHPQSFHDDPTRALRAARLAPRLGFTLARESRSWLRDALRDGAFARVSGDRYRRELEKLFDDAKLGLDPARALRGLDQAHVLGALEPGLSLVAEAVPPLRRLGRAIAAPPWAGPGWRPLEVGLALWLAPLTPALRVRALRRLAMRGAAADRIATAPKLRDRCLRALARARGRGAVDALLRELREEELIALHAWSDAAARRRIARFAGEDRAQRAPLDGGDVVALGLAGADVGEALARVRAAYLDGLVRTRDEALALAAECGRQTRRGSGRRSGTKPKRGE